MSNKNTMCHSCPDGLWCRYSLVHGLILCSSVVRLSHVRHVMVKFGITGLVWHLAKYQTGLK